MKLCFPAFLFGAGPGLDEERGCFLREFELAIEGPIAFSRLGREVQTDITT
jgi:hypothetical protein